MSTVSYALNGKGRVDAATRARVQEVADRLGYRANRSAQNLRSGRTATLGLMLPLPTNCHRPSTSISTGTGAWRPPRPRLHSTPITHSSYYRR
ncbi:LacI family DNA-binding transcriptional regulator [Rhodococcus sp. 3Y1]